ncbi:ATP-grasp domain-containing protein [Mycolicibacterium komossense]|uniref:ATP-grasp domain-containing protein n=1 Tax=Mycolicibacterium komossense TaxID=1779 RepID=A0ABT3CDW8_9MYCO|nr:ATP-grasp domain-containing protein [Mycolicibacterium komossense]MCV7227684.1 ATP-grasp domain-containing protein [Mycolicibacterium komossense]
MARPRRLLYLDTRGLPNERQAEILAATNHGDTVVMATSNPQQYRGYDLEHVITAPLNDHPTAERVILSALREARLKIDGVIAWKDGEVELAARIGAALGLPATPLKMVPNVRNKFRTRQALEQLVGANPRYHPIRSSSDLVKALSVTGVPCLIKPAGNSGGRGIRRINSDSDPEEVYREFIHYNAAQSEPMYQYYNDIALVEEVLTGSEHSISGLVADGRVSILAVVDKEFDRSLSLQYQNVVPTLLAEKEIARLLVLARAAVTATGIDNCGFHIDVMLTASGPKILEIGGRLGGELINSHLIPLAQPSLNPYRMLIDIVTGTTISIEEDYTGSYRSQAGARMVMPPNFGTIVAISGVERVRCDSRCRDFVQLYGPGSQMVPPRIQYKAFEIGYIVAQSTTGDIMDALNDLAGRIDVTMADTCNGRSDQ